ncbi:TEA domain-containing protein [Mycena sanguinolenta]|uniref:TEA domain-containing protein n=1 Tax=Mycena sanguinolenta TaxID=230812 RepID=A0A8H6YS99_9AGAR|nr:TEA domain-containing protein [Mycena sanguinolenta]
MADIQPQQGTSKTLTPQRKHRKLLKDGSGTPVWPESIEAVFVQGLREYWDSPWATYSRGRSRWRNQFLVDYLQSLGITRSKKQVASHIQVLRNMWKGEPEYHLVAGGEELADPVKVEAHDASGLLSLEDDEDYSSPDNSPHEVVHEIPAAPGLSHSPSSPLSSLSSDIGSPPHNFSHLAGPYSYAAQNQKAYTAPGYPAFVHAQPPTTTRYPNRTTGLTLLADGMTAFTVNIDRLVEPVSHPGRTPPQTLRIRLAIPPVDDTRAPPNLHGFFGQVQLAAVWSSQAKVFTRVYDASGHCFSSEVESLQPNSVELGTVVAALPESALSRARWLDSSVQTRITQQIVVDNATLLQVIYELDRRAHHSALPSAELVAFQPYADARAQMASPMVYTQPSTNYGYTGSASNSTPPQMYTSNGYYAPQSAAYGHVQHAHPPQPPINTSSYTPSLSSALTPVALLRSS